MSKSKLLSIALLAVAVIGAPVAVLLSFEAVALGLAALPGAIAAALALDIRTRTRAQARSTAAWQRSTDARLGQLEHGLERVPTRAQVVAAEDVERIVQGLEDRVVEQIRTTREALERPPVRADVPTHDDVLGTVRVIQARYEGRLDRAQAALDETVAALRAQLKDSPTGRSEA